MKNRLLTHFVLGALLLGFSVQTSLADVTKPFTDVEQGSEYYDALVYLKQQNVVQGYPDGSFQPYKTINRAEFTKIVVGFLSDLEINAADDKAFKDLEKGAWYIPYVSLAKVKGYVEGYDDGTFKPDQKINFVEAAKIVVTSTGGEWAGAGYEEWYHKYVSMLENLHAIPTTILSFDQKITRGEMAEMMYRLQTENVGKPSSTYADLAQPKGIIEGSLSYPSEGIPPSLKICADDVANANTYCMYSKIEDSKYVYGIGYKLPVPAGTYHVYAASDIAGYNGLYSEFVTCGMDANNCKSHAYINVTVDNGQTVKDIDPADWYAMSQ